MFANHLESPIGKSLDCNTIEQHIAQLRALMKFTSFDSENYRKLLTIAEINSPLIRFQKPKHKGGNGIKNRTVRGYISAVKHFLKLTKVTPNCFPMLKPSKMDILYQQLTNISKGLKKGCQREIVHRKENYLKRLPTNSDLRKYINCDIRRKVISKLLTSNHLTNLTGNEVVLSNGLLLVEISLDNANRAGEVRYLRMTDFNFNSGKFEEDGSVTVKMRHQKTCYLYGPAILTLKPEVYSYMART